MVNAVIVAAVQRNAESGVLPLPSMVAELCSDLAYERTMNALLLGVIEELAGDLEIFINREYADRQHYPSEMTRYDRDMLPVVKARALAAKARTVNEAKQ